jgi:predicted permease
MLVAQLSTWAYTAKLDLSPDWRVAGVGAGATILTAVLCSIAPAFRAIHADPVDAIKPQGSGGGRERRLGPGGALVVAQVALSLMLVVAAGLFLRSFTALAYRDIGFDRDAVLMAIVDARRSITPPEARLGLYEQLREAASSVPGVETAAVSMATPLGSAGVRFTPVIAIPGSTVPADAIRILTNPVSGEWFRTFGTQLLAGRDFDSRDREHTAPVVIVNQAFARRYFDGANPIGRAITEIDDAQKRRSLEIVGLVEDAAFTSVRDAIEPTMYAPIAQRVSPQMLASFPSISISVRPKTDSSTDVARGVINAIAAVDPALTISVQTVTEQLNVFYIRERLLAQLSVFFGAFALFLAGLGLYAVTAYAVGRRRVEIGIRMAIGAEPASVRQMILCRVMLLAGLGVLTGAVASFWAVQVVRTLLYQIPPRDMATFALAGLLLVMVAAIAGWLPARRAAHLDPAVVLREN